MLPNTSVAATVLAELPFSIERDHCILVEVEINDGKASMIFDTGADVTFLDRALARSLLGPPRRRVFGIDGTGTVTNSVQFDKASLHLGGSWSTTLPRIETFRHGQGQWYVCPRLQGFVGRDVMQRQIIELNFDDERIRLWSDVPKNAGDWVRMGPSGNIFLNVNGTIEYFYLDTGGLADDLQVTNDLFDRLHLEIVGSNLAGGIAGSVPKSQSIAENIGIGDHVIDRVMIGSGCHTNIIGLKFIRRFNCVLDFRAGRLYLRPSKYFSKMLEPSAYGLQFDRRCGCPWVREIIPNSPAAHLGIEVGDVLCEVNHLPTDGLPVYAIHQMLRKLAGTTVPLALTRRLKPYTVELELPNTTGDGTAP